MNKRISIVTWLGVGNYGTALQAFALQHKLKLMGHESQLLRKIGVVRSIRETIGKILLQHKKQSPKEQTMDAFWQKHCHVRNVYSILPKTKLRAETDLFLTGSDQIWNTNFYFDRFYFLSFAGQVRRAAYSSSIGTASVNRKYASRVAKYLNRFSHIGVREESAVKVLQQLTGRKDIRQVLDPTLLIDGDEWRSLGSLSHLAGHLPESYMLVYLIGNNPDYQNLVSEIALQNKVEKIVVAASEESTLKIEGDVCIDNASPLDFVHLIGNARLVCTDSFHATALSINMATPFVVLKRFSDTDTASQNSRIYDLLGRYDLQHCLYDGQNASSSIDFDKVHTILAEDIRVSEQFLTDIIDNR